MKVILITGASSGIGYTTAKELAKQGHKVYGAARRLEKLEELKSDGVTPMYLDITDEASITNCVESIVKAEGRIDVLVNNAGYGSYGPLESVEISEARKQFEVNVFGLAALTKEVIPVMRKQNSGRIINISSMGGRLVSYFGGWYHATKYAVEAYSDALRMEVAGFGIQVSLIEPGGVKTDWGLIAADHLEGSVVNTAYQTSGMKAAEGMRKQYRGNMMSNPMVITKAISKAINSRKPKTRYLIGFGAKPLVFMKLVLPTKMFDTIMKNAS